MTSSLKRHLPALGLLAALLLALFFRSFDPALTLSVGDASLAVIRGLYRMRDTVFTGTWVATGGLGNPGFPSNITPGTLFAFLVPFFKYVDANAIFALFLMGMGGYFLIHDITRNRFASFMGGLIMMLQPHVLSHLQPGHVGHFMMAAWVPLLVLFTRRAALNGGLNWIYAGACGGAMMSGGQHDVTALIALSIAAYGLFLLIRNRTRRNSAKSWIGVAGGVAAAAVLAILMSYQAMVPNLLKQLSLQKDAIGLETAQADTMSDSERWFWATQWSIPPVETADMAIPGFFGWGSSDPVNPYRGRIGQTEGWMTHQQGMPNLNDVCQYLGAGILLGILLAVTLKKRDPEIWCFAGIGLISLLLAFGKFAPFYRYFYSLPNMDMFRNPIKWFYVTSLFAGILGAVGLAEASRADFAPWPRLKAALLAFLPGLTMLMLGALLLAKMEGNPFPFWQQPRLVTLSAASLSRAALFWSVAGLAVFLMLSSRRTGHSLGLKAGALLTALVMAGELIYVNIHYMPYHEWAPALDAGPFRPFLESIRMPCRFRFLRQDGPFWKIHEIAAMEGMEFADPYPTRLPDEFMLLQRRMEQADPVKFWRLSNVRYVVAPGALQDPRFNTILSLKAGSTPLVVSELKTALNRCVWISSWRKVPKQMADELMVNPAFDPGTEALIHTDDPLPAPAASPDVNAMCRITSYSLNRVQAETESTHSGMTVLLSRYNPDWKAFVDGRPVPVWRANSLLMACAVPAGRHHLEWRFTVPNAMLGLRLTLAGWVLAFLTVLIGVILNVHRASGKTA